MTTWWIRLRTHMSKPKTHRTTAHARITCREGLVMTRCWRTKAFYLLNLRKYRSVEAARRRRRRKYNGFQLQIILDIVCQSACPTTSTNMVINWTSHPHPPLLKTRRTSITETTRINLLTTWMARDWIQSTFPLETASLRQRSNEVYRRKTNHHNWEKSDHLQDRVRRGHHFARFTPTGASTELMTNCSTLQLTMGTWQKTWMLQGTPRDSTLPIKMADAFSCSH